VSLYDPLVDCKAVHCRGVYVKVACDHVAEVTVKKGCLWSDRGVGGVDGPRTSVAYPITSEGESRTALGCVEVEGHEVFRVRKKRG